MRIAAFALAVLATACAGTPDTRPINIALSSASQPAEIDLGVDGDAIALALSGGGARAAYQAGALQALAAGLAASAILSASRITSSGTQGLAQNFAPSGNGCRSGRPEVTMTSSSGSRCLAMCASSTPSMRPARFTSVIIRTRWSTRPCSTSTAASALAHSITS